MSSEKFRKTRNGVPYKFSILDMVSRRWTSSVTNTDSNVKINSLSLDHAFESVSLHCDVVGSSNSHDSVPLLCVFSLDKPVVFNVSFSFINYLGIATGGEHEDASFRQIHVNKVSPYGKLSWSCEISDNPIDEELAVEHFESEVVQIVTVNEMVLAPFNVSERLFKHDPFKRHPTLVKQDVCAGLGESRSVYLGQLGIGLDNWLEYKSSIGGVTLELLI